MKTVLDVIGFAVSVGLVFAGWVLACIAIGGCATWQIPPDQLDANGEYHRPEFDLPKLTGEEFIEAAREHAEARHKRVMEMCGLSEKRQTLEEFLREGYGLEMEE